MTATLAAAAFVGLVLFVAALSTVLDAIATARARARRTEDAVGEALADSDVGEAAADSVADSVAANVFLLTQGLVRDRDGRFYVPESWHPTRQ